MLVGFRLSDRSLLMNFAYGPSTIFRDFTLAQIIKFECIFDMVSHSFLKLL